MLVQSDVLVNPFHEITRAMKAITKKRVKTDDDLRELSRLEFYGSLYYDDILGPYLPGDNIVACLRDGAKRTKAGKTAYTP